MIVGLLLLVVAYAGNPQAAFARVVTYFGGGTGSTGGASGASSGSAAVPGYKIPSGAAKLVANQSAPVTPGITSTGKPTVVIPVQDLSPWQQFVHFLTSNDPFYNSGVAKP